MGQLLRESTISLQLGHSDPSVDDLRGFRFFWAFRVAGFRPGHRCQACFRGSLVREFSARTVPVGPVVEVTLQPRHRYLYVCGVGSGPKNELHRKNFHLPLRYAPGATVTHTTYNGYTVTAYDAAELPIPPLERGWRGLDEETTRCKNFQFAVAYLGLDGPPPAAYST